MLNNLKIAISGKSGCGNTTVSNIVADRLNLRHINYTFKDLARERGIPFEELYKRVETDSQYDIYLDKKQVQLASTGNCVLGSRLAIWLLYDADVKVFLDAPIKVRAKRIAKREKIGFRKALQETEHRDKNDRARFLRLYSIDNNEYKFANLIINTELGDVDYVVNCIIDYVQLHC